MISNGFWIMFTPILPSQKNQTISDRYKHTFPGILHLRIFRNSHEIFQIRHEASAHCLDALSKTGINPGVRTCHGLGGFQTLIYTKEGLIRSAQNCLQPNKNGNVTMKGCSNDYEHQKWDFNRGKLVNRATKECLYFDSSLKDEEVPKKSMLNFLANLAQDLLKDVPRPSLVNCDSAKNGNHEMNAKWVMDEPVNWDIPVNENQSP